MAEFSQDAVLHFLQSRGGSVTNAELLLHFRPFLREHADRERNRERFKSFVNSVARVKQEDGVSHVVLLRRFRGHGEGRGGRGESPGSTQGNAHLSPLWSVDKPRSKSPEAKAVIHPGPEVLPAAGIVLNNNTTTTTVEPNLKLLQHRVQQSHELSQVLRSSPGRHSEATPTPGLLEAPLRREVRPAPLTHSEPPEPKLLHDRAPVPVSSDRPSPPSQGLPHTSAPVSPGQVHNNMSRQKQPSSAKPVPPSDPPAGPPPVNVSFIEAPLPSRAPRTTARHRQSYRSALSLGGEDDDDEEDEDEEGVVVSDRRASAPLLSAAVLGVDTSPSPVLLQSPGTTSEELTPPSQPQKVAPVRMVPQIHIQGVEPEPRRGSEPQPRFRTGFPLPIHGLYGSSSSLGQSSKVGRASSGWSSCEELSRHGAQIERQSWQRPAAEEIVGETRGKAWHRSTGDLYDDGPDTSVSSAPSPPTLMRPAVTRRQSSNMKRMCLSVGADLDQLIDEDEKRALGGSEAARLHRLHLISSSLSLRHVSSMSSLSSCSTPPRSHSLADLTNQDSPRERRSVQSTPQPQEGSSKQSHVPLDEREHLWMVKSASGTWPDIYSLFREDPSLLHKRDFISGFTVLHWIAKHGDHRVLNTLWYGVEKAGLMFETDAQSSCGYTPLHIAAMHNHKNIIRLLVNKFKAKVSLRDSAGRKAWFYLPPEAPPDLFQLLGAPAKAALGPSTVGQSWGAPQTHPQTQRRRKRHRFSSASGQRPLTFSGDAKVKRSSSLAAFLKHKSLQKVKAEWAI